MCAGDLGMYRVMPWSYPPISGGSSGGFSPDDSGDTGGSVITNALYVDTDNTTFDWTILRVYQGNNVDILQSNIQFGYLGVGNLRNVSKVTVHMIINDLYMSGDPSKNLVDLLKTTDVDVNTYTLPFDDIINGTITAIATYDFNTGIDETQTVVSAHSTIKIVAYDSNGIELRSYSHDLEWGT